MKTVNFDIDENEIEIIPLADLHIGSPECDELLVKEVCDYIERTPNCYTILNGDIVDNNIRNSVGSPFEQTQSPKGQITTATYYLSKIAAQKKIINMTVGNHELRSEKETGLSPSDLLLANLLKYDESLNKRYCADGAYTFLTLNGRDSDYKNYTKVCFTIFNLHGTGGGSRIGAKIQRLENMSSIVPAHLYIRSHSHQVETHRGVFLNVDANSHTIKEESCVFVNTNSFLKYGGYGARAGMKPLSRGIPVITLKAIRKCKGRKEMYIRNIECVIKERLEG